jgi:hypothetical protein
MLFLVVITSKKMKKRKKKENLKRREKRRNLMLNFLILIQKLETGQMLILGMKNLITEEKIKFIQVLKFIIHLEENLTFNLVDQYSYIPIINKIFN